MNKGILQFSFNGKKITYFRRFDLFGKPLITTNQNNAKLIKETNVKDITIALAKEYGKTNIKDVKFIKEE